MGGVTVSWRDRRTANRLSLLVLLVGLVAVGATIQPAPPVAAQTTDPPNVLIIMTDDQRVEGSEAVMPSLVEEFKDGGTHFPNAVATTPLCCPARASVFSGRYPHNHGVTRNDNAKARFDQTTSMQFQLGNAGYSTAFVGKYFNAWKGDIPHFDYVAKRTGYYKPDGTYSTNVMESKAVEFLNEFESNDDQPWLMYVWTTAPHEPARPENQYQNATVPGWVDNPATLESNRNDKPAYVQAINPTTKQMNQLKNLRLKMLRSLMSVDDLVGTVFDELDELDESDDTLAFYLTDNGYQWGEHKLRYKRHPYNDSVRIPMYVRWPGRFSAGVVDTDIVGNVDIAPTVYEAAGVTPAHVIDGQSMLTSSREYILLESLEGTRNVPYTDSPVPVWRSLWHPTWSYVEYEDGFREYYSAGDPWQLENLFANGVSGDEPADAAELQTLLNEHADCVGSACP